VGRLRSAANAPHLAVFGALAAGVVLRGLLLSRPGLHPDEALYASWALRIADGSDPALLGVYVDKPPLLLYLLAGVFRLASFDGTAAPDIAQLVLAGRLAALLASAASLALLWLLARRAYGPAVALAALALFALSPLAVRLAPTLFTDPWLALWMLLSLWAALTGRAWVAGIACGLAFATKQQALLLAPLLLAVFLATLRHPAHPLPASAGRLAWRWLNGFALVAALVIWWDSLRWQWMPSYWDRSAQTYGAVGLALDASLLPRLAQWGELLGYAFGWPLWLALGALLVGALLARRGRATPDPFTPGWLDRLLLVFVAAYLLLHVATSLAAWDRYLLPVLPLLALLLARGAVWAWQAVAQQRPAGGSRWIKTGVAAGMALSMLYAGYTAGFAPLPLGDGGGYDGVARVAAHVRAAEAPGAMLYHQALGWHYNFYLYDAPVDLRWWQDPADLARKAAAGVGQRQLIAFAAGREDEPGARAALARAGLALRPVAGTGGAPWAPSATLYSIEPLLAGAPTRVR
jgi:4-amino-4-deoxy-L-arabinose transferase-like glycosyltransferase